MKNLFFPLLWGMLSMLSCTSKDAAVRVEKINGHKLYVCDFFKVKDEPGNVKLTEMLKSIEIVKLENDTNALVAPGGPVYISENCILLRSNNRTPFKLFNRQGKFICDLGTIGRGAGEYTTVYDVQIDEKNERIYLLPWQTRALLSYDFKGNLVESINLLGGTVPKGKFEVKDGNVKILSLPFKRSVKWVAYQQTLDGKLLDSVAAEPYSIESNFSNELKSCRETESLHFFVWKGTQDTMYKYIPGNNQLVPYFTVDFGNSEVPMHEYSDWGRYIWFLTSIVKTDHGTYNQPDKSMLIDKKDLSVASSFRIENDFLGYAVNPWYFKGHYFIHNTSPLRLKQKLDEVVKKGNLTLEMQERIDNLLADIDEEGNNYVIFGELKDWE